MRWVMMLVEGGHDQNLIVKLLESSNAGWSRREPTALPSSIRSKFPVHAMDPTTGTFRGDRAPSYLERDDTWLEIRAAGGQNDVLGKKGRSLIRSIADEVSAILVVVDADDAGVPARTASFRSNFEFIPSVGGVTPGRVGGDKPMIGLWVAPDNSAAGSLTNLALEIALLSKSGPLVTRATEFIDQTGISLGENERAKAILGTAGQPVLPGASLAMMLHRADWLAASPMHEVAKNFVKWIEEACDRASAAPAPVPEAR